MKLKCSKLVFGQTPGIGPQSSLFVAYSQALDSVWFWFISDLFSIFKFMYILRTYSYHICISVSANAVHFTKQWLIWINNSLKEPAQKSHSIVNHGMWCLFLIHKNQSVHWSYSNVNRTVCIICVFLLCKDNSIEKYMFCHYVMVQCIFIESHSVHTTSSRSQLR